MPSRVLRWAMLLLVVALAACNGNVNVIAETVFDGDPVAANDVFVNTFTVAPEVTDSYVRLRIDVSAGVFGFVLTDPTGAERWSGRVEPEPMDEEDIAAATAAAESPEEEEEALNLYEFDEERFFRPIAGDWTLVITTEEATGHFNGVWRDTNNE